MGPPEAESKDESAGEAKEDQSGGDDAEPADIDGATEEDSVADDTSSENDVYEEESPSEPDSEFDISTVEWDDEFDDQQRSIKLYRGQEYVRVPFSRPFARLTFALIRPTTAPTAPTAS